MHIFRDMIDISFLKHIQQFLGSKLQVICCQQIFKEEEKGGGIIYQVKIKPGFSLWFIKALT